MVDGGEEADELPPLPPPHPPTASAIPDSATSSVPRNAVITESSGSGLGTMPRDAKTRAALSLLIGRG